MVQTQYNEFWTEKHELIRQKRNTLLTHIDADEDSDVEHSGRHDCLFYCHGDSVTMKYMVFTLEELKQFLFDEIKKNFASEQYSMEVLSQVTGFDLEQVQNFFLPNIMIGDERIMGGKYRLEDDTTTNIYYVKSSLVVDFVKEKMSLDDFIKKYIDYTIKEQLCYNVFSYWKSFIIDGFYLFLIEN